MVDFMKAYEKQTYALMRIMAGFLFIWHGTNKLFGFPGESPATGYVKWVAGGIEFVGGALIMIGLFTAPAAFLASARLAATARLAMTALPATGPANRAAVGINMYLPEDEPQALLDGSARMALQSEPPFDKYIFIEKSAARCAQLELLRDEFAEVRPLVAVFFLVPRLCEPFTDVVAGYGKRLEFMVAARIMDHQDRGPSRCLPLRWQECPDNGILVVLARNNDPHVDFRASHQCRQHVSHPVFQPAIDDFGAFPHWQNVGLCQRIGTRTDRNGRCSKQSEQFLHAPGHGHARFTNHAA